MNQVKIQVVSCAFAIKTTGASGSGVAKEGMLPMMAQKDADLLNDLFNEGPAGSKENPTTPSGTFSAQWNAMFDKTSKAIPPLSSIIHRSD